jgi:predicted phosphodiesterase
MMKIAIITDIHEDIMSLQAALRQIDKHKVDEVVCLGDISGYSVPYYNYLHSRNAHECLALIRSSCKHVILGNHDMHAAGIIPRNCSFFSFPENWYQLDYQQRHKMANHTLWLHEEHDLNPLYKNEDIDFLKSLPEHLVIETGAHRILFTHYIYPNLTGLKKEFYTYGSEFNKHFHFMESMQCDISFAGHSHVKGFYMADQKKFRQYRYVKKHIQGGMTCIGIPPVTSKGKRSGFCIFDSGELSVRAVRI